MVFKESRVLINDSKLCFATLINEKLGLLGLFHYFNDTWALFLWNFLVAFSKVSWIYSTLTNRSSLHCKPSDGTIFVKNLLNFSATRLISDTILVLSSMSAIFCLTLFLSETNGLTVYQKRLLSTIFFVSRLLKNNFFSLRERDTQ